MGLGTYQTQTPSTIPGLVLWLDADDATTITSSANAVSSWRDKSGRGNNATQGTSANQPATGTRTSNGRNVLDFDGTNDVLTLASNNIFDQPFTFFVVAQADTIASVGSFISRQQGSETGGFNIRVNGDSTNFTAFGVGAAFSTVNQASVNTNMNIHNVSFDLSTSYSINNGTVTTAGTVVTYDNASVRNATIGAVQSGSEYFNGAIAEIIFYNRVIGSSDRSTVLRYLSNKWGVAIS